METEQLIMRAVQWLSMGLSDADCWDKLVGEGIEEGQAQLVVQAAKVLAKDLF